jgi:hypothetical protein
VWPNSDLYFSNVTAFDDGEYFTDADQVRECFKIKVMEHLSRCSKKIGLTQADLDEMAGAVIHQRWHSVF